METNTNLTPDDFLKYLIKNTEARYIDYTKMLADLFKNKDLYAGEHFDWYKDTLRDNKNSEEKALKSLRLELEHLRHGMNPPFCYVSYKSKEK